MEKKITLREFLQSVRNLKEERDVYIDTMEGFSYGGTLLTEEGERVFAEALELPMEGNCVYSPDDADYPLIDKGEGKLYLAFLLISGMAGYCSCEDWDKWFIEAEY